MGVSRLLVGQLTTVTVLLLAVQSVYCQRNYVTLYEGSACVLRDGVVGTCRLLTQCPSQLNMFSTDRRFQPLLCGFQGSSPIVCCPHEEGHIPTKLPWWLNTSPPVPVTQRTPTPTPTPKPFPTQPPTPAPTPQPTKPPVTGSGALTKHGQKSSRACEAYSKQVSKFVQPLIFNGRSATPGEYPYMALLGYRPPPQTTITWNCGGALISDRFVVTAAHCFTNNMLRAPVAVRLGEFDLADDEDSAVDFGIKRLIRHPKYNKQSWYHDLALIELNQLVKFSRFIQPACIWNQPQDPDKGLIITGWGSIQQNGDGPMNEILLEGNGTLSKVSPEMCTEFYTAASLQLRNGIQEGILCAMDLAGTVDTCSGDSGGPIQVKTNMNRGVQYYVVGVTSGGSKWCGSIPSIYTSLYWYIDWIESVVWAEN